MNQGLTIDERMNTEETKPASPWDLSKVSAMGPDLACSQWLRAKEALAALRDTKNIEVEIIAYGNACAEKVPGLSRLDSAPAKAGGVRGPKRASASVDDVCNAITKLYVAGTNGVKTKAIEAACDGKSIGAGVKAGLDQKRIEVKNMGKGAAGGNFYKPVVKAPERASQKGGERK